jgi:hypothetical protein
MRYALPAAVLAAAIGFGLTACKSSDASRKGDAPKLAESAIPVEIARPAPKERLATYSRDDQVVVAHSGPEAGNKVRGIRLGWAR